MEIARALFPGNPPNQQEEDEGNPRVWTAKEAIPVTVEEVIKAAGRLKAKKAPGPDGIKPETVKEVIKIAPDPFAKIYGDLLAKGEFPRVWKTARLVLVWKDKESMEAPSSNRPICLLDTLGKTLETIVRGKLLKEMEEGESLAHTQYGFREGRSTVQVVETVAGLIREAGQRSVCVLITQDVRNAFKTARWKEILEALNRRQEVGVETGSVIENYLCDRRILIGNDSMDCHSEVSQGSVLGPILWNCMYNGLLREQLPTGATTVSFADDVARSLAMRYRSG